MDAAAAAANAPPFDYTLSLGVSLPSAVPGRRRQPHFRLNEEPPCASEDEDCEDEISGHHPTGGRSRATPLHSLQYNERVEILRLEGDTDDGHRSSNNDDDVVSVETLPVTLRVSAVTPQQPIESPVVGGNSGRGSVAVGRRTPDWIPRGGSASGGLTVPPTSRLKVSEGVTPGGGRKTSHLGASERDGIGAADTDELASSTRSSPSSSALGMNIGLIVGIASGVLLLVFVLAYAVYKYLSSQGEGSYKLDGTDKYCFEAFSESKTVTTTSATPRTTAAAAAHAPKKKQIKEWYV